MRLRRKGSENPEITGEGSEGHDDPLGSVDDDAAGAAGAAQGPWDIDELPEDDGVGRVDLGSILVAPLDDCELRVQVDEASGEVRAILVATETGAVELRAFAAARNGDLWGEVRPQIAADTERRGGKAVEHEGRFGTELRCEVAVALADGTSGVQATRVVGVNGPRWLLRATFIGQPAQDPATAQLWDEVVAGVVVRRGAQAMPVGEQLPLRLPDGANPRPVGDA